jgi:hypothetical protein
MASPILTDPAQPFAWRLFLSYLGTFVTLTVVVGLLVVLAVGTRPLERLVAVAQPAPAPTITIQWPKVRPAEGQAPVTWVPEQQRDALLDRARHALADGTPDLSGASLARVGAALQQSGWFTGRPVVRRGAANSLIIDGQWRVPAAVVRRGGTDQLISWEGAPMPVTLPAGQARFPVIENPAMAAPTLADGTLDCASAWAGEDMAASLELLQVLLRQPWGSQVAGVDASRFAIDKSLTLTTAFGTRVVWGGRVSKPLLGEVSSSQKLAHLSGLFDKHRRIDAGFPMIYVNSTKLQFDISATAQALAAAEEPQPNPPALRGE